MRNIYICLILLHFINFSFGVIYISEIDFGDYEFVEIYSNESLNLSNATIYDANLNKFNKIDLFKKSNSSFNLIVGSRFIDNQNISNFNCTIYLSDKSQVSNGGLKSQGESLFVEVNSSFNLSYYHLNDFEFALNESLNYDALSNDFYLSNKSICDYNSQSVNSNSNSSLKNDLELQIPIFNLEIEDFLVFDKVYFDFDTNISNFTIEYWIEDYLGNIVKSPRKTTNLNLKSWSPKGISNVYKIKAILDSGSGFYNVSKLFYYYSNASYVVDFNSKDVKLEKEISKVLIKNKNDVVSGKSTSVKYEIYKGNTLKRSVYFYLNGVKIHSINLNKYSSLKGELELKNYLVKGKNEFLIVGLDLESRFIFMNDNVFYSDSKVISDSNSLKNPRFDFISQNNSLIVFDLYNFVENKDIFCKVFLDVIEVSDELNFRFKEDKYTLKLLINNSKLKEENFETGKKLRLICKYKIVKNFKSILTDFNYFLVYEDLNISSNLELINFYSFDNISNGQINKSLSFSSVKLSSINNSSNNVTIFLSENLKMKDKSIIFFLIVLVLIICVLVLNW